MRPLRIFLLSFPLLVGGCEYIRTLTEATLGQTVTYGPESVAMVSAQAKGIACSEYSATLWAATTRVESGVLDQEPLAEFIAEVEAARRAGGAFCSEIDPYTEVPASQVASIDYATDRIKRALAISAEEGGVVDG